MTNAVRVLAIVICSSMAATSLEADAVTELRSSTARNALIVPDLVRHPGIKVRMGGPQVGGGSGSRST